MLVGLAKCAEVIAEVQDLAALVGREGDVVQARSVAAGEGDVVHGRLAIHPGRVDGLVLVLDVFRHLEAEGLVVSRRPREHPE